MPGSMVYTIAGPDGQPTTVDEGHVLTQAQKAGYPVTGVTADGQYMTAQEPPDAKGKAGAGYKYPISQYLRDVGYQIHGVQPSASQESTVEPLLSGMISAMPEDDNLKKSYIKHTLESRGIANPQVVGNGHNWHVFDPGAQQWAQLSKEPGFDMSGLAAGAMAAPHILGAMAGGVGGAMAGGGLGSIPLAAAGGAAGSALGSGATELGMYGLDPDYRAAVNEQKGSLNAIGTDMMKTAAYDAAGEAIGAPIGKALGHLTAPIAKALGGGLEGAGGIVSDVAGKVASKPGAVTVATDLLNPIGAVNTAGQAASALQVPAEAITGIPKAARAFSQSDWANRIAGLGQKIADHPVTSPMFGEETGAALRAGSGRANASVDALKQSAGNFADQALAGGGSAEDVLSSIMRRRAAKAKYLADPGWQAAEEEGATAARQVGAHQGMAPDQIEKLVEANRGKFRGDVINLMAGSEETPIASGIGRAADQAHAAGVGLQKGADLTTRAGLRGIQAAGKGMQATGRSLPYADIAARYGLIPGAANYGVHRGLNEYENEGRP